MPKKTHSSAQRSSKAEPAPASVHINRQYHSATAKNLAEGGSYCLKQTI